MLIQTIIAVNFVATWLQIAMAYPTNGYGTKEMPNSSEPCEDSISREPFSHPIEVVDSYQHKLLENQYGDHTDSKIEVPVYRKRDSQSSLQYDQKMTPSYMTQRSHPSTGSTKPFFASQPLGSFMNGLPYRPLMHPGTESESNSKQSYQHSNGIQKPESTYKVHLYSDYNNSNSYQTPQASSENTKEISNSKSESKDPYVGPDSYNPSPIRNSYSATMTNINPEEHKKDSKKVNLEDTSKNTQQSSQIGLDSYTSYLNEDPYSYSDFGYPANHNQGTQNGKQTYNVQDTLPPSAYKMYHPKDNLHESYQYEQDKGNSYEHTFREKPDNVKQGYDAPQLPHENISPYKDTDSYMSMYGIQSDPSADSGTLYQAQEDSKLLKSMDSHQPDENYDGVYKYVYSAPSTELPSKNEYAMSPEESYLKLSPDMDDKQPGYQHEMDSPPKELYNPTSHYSYKSAMKDTYMLPVDDKRPSELKNMYGTLPEDSYKPESMYGDGYKAQHGGTSSTYKGMFAEPPDDLEDPQQHNYDEEPSTADMDTTDLKYHMPQDSYKSHYKDFHPTADENPDESPKHTKYKSPMKYIEDDPPFNYMEDERPFKNTHDKPSIINDESHFKYMNDELPYGHDPDDTLMDSEQSMKPKPDKIKSMDDEPPMQYMYDEHSFKINPDETKFTHDGPPYKYFHDDHYYENDHHDYENQTEKYHVEYKTKEHNFSYKIGRKLWLVPLYAGALFLVQFLVELLRYIARHKSLVPYVYLPNKNEWRSSRDIDEVAADLMLTVDKAKKLYK